MGGENLHEIRFEDVELPPENLVLEDGFRKLLRRFNTQRCLNPRFRWASPRARSKRRSNTPRSARCSAARRRFSGDALEDRRDVPRDRDRRSMLYRACASADPFPDPLLAAAAKVTFNEMALQGDERGDPGAWRLRLYRRVPGVALLPRRALRHLGRRHQRDPERPDRQARASPGSTRSTGFRASARSERGNARLRRAFDSRQGTPVVPSLIARVKRVIAARRFDMGRDVALVNVPGHADQPFWQRREAVKVPF